MINFKIGDIGLDYLGPNDFGLAHEIGRFDIGVDDIGINDIGLNDIVVDDIVRADYS